MDERTVRGTFTSIVTDMCPTCRGVFLDGGELGELLGEQAPQPGQAQGTSRDEELACPGCSKPMGVTSYHGVEVDLCPSCASLWLDRGELADIQQAVRQRREKQEELAEAVNERGLEAVLLALGKE
jgi:Zn-finger nucleic acid-binding protein